MQPPPPLFQFPYSLLLHSFLFFSFPVVKGSAQVIEQLDNPLYPFIPLFMYVLCILLHFVPSRCLSNVTSPAPIFFPFFYRTVHFVLEKSFLDVHSCVSSPVRIFLIYQHCSPSLPPFLLLQANKMEERWVKLHQILSTKKSSLQRIKSNRIKRLFFVQFFPLKQERKSFHFFFYKYCFLFRLYSIHYLDFPKKIINQRENSHVFLL